MSYASKRRRELRKRWGTTGPMPHSRRPYPLPIRDVWGYPRCFDAAHIAEAVGEYEEREPRVQLLGEPRERED